VRTDAKGFIIVDDQCRMNVPGIWALGDVNGRGAFTHASWNDFEIVAANLFDGDPRRISQRITCYGLLLGAAILGIEGDEVVQAFLGVMAAGVPYTSISRMVHVHPTVAEYLPVLLNDLQPLGSAAKESERTNSTAEGGTGERAISGAIRVSG
jgi:pyruvate/2-oxoglutarate dehydrogenase complex dihydrolipoamide dehydrogenase (E3) component